MKQGWERLPESTFLQKDGARRELRSLQDRCYREEAMLQNDHLSAADKVVFIMLERLYPEVKSGWVTIEAWKLTKHAGVTRQTVSRFFTAMEEKQYIEREVKRGMKVTRAEGITFGATVRVRELPICKAIGKLNTVDTVKREEDRARLRCQSCGHTVFEQREIVTCTKCGEVLYDHRKITEIYRENEYEEGEEDAEQE